MSNSNNNKDPLKELLEEQLSDPEKARTFSVPADSKIHFLFLYSSVKSFINFATTFKFCSL